MVYRAWTSWQAMEETIRQDTVAVASGLHISTSLVRKWKEQPLTDEDFFQSGTRNPLDRIETVISTIEKTDPERAYLPIRWLCARFRFMPPVKLPDAGPAGKDVQKALLDWTREFGETCAEISKDLADGRISPPELRRIHKEILEDMAAVMALFHLLEEMG